MSQSAKQSPASQTAGLFVAVAVGTFLLGTRGGCSGLKFEDPTPPKVQKERDEISERHYKATKEWYKALRDQDDNPSQYTQDRVDQRQKELDRAQHDAMESLTDQMHELEQSWKK